MNKSRISSIILIILVFLSSSVWFIFKVLNLCIYGIENIYRPLFYFLVEMSIIVIIWEEVIKKGR